MNDVNNLLNNFNILQAQNNSIPRQCDSATLRLCKDEIAVVSSKNESVLESPHPRSAKVRGLAAAI